MAGYPVPDPSSLPPLPTTNILLESVSLSSSGLKEKLHVQGAFIVRNLNFHKDVTLRFTLDNWDTISEVKALWVANFPSPFAVQRSSIKDNHSWDRFSFSINLSDYPLASLPSKTLYFVGKYTVPGAEYWDNCGGRNWRIKFKVAKADAAAAESVPSNLPNVVVSPPTASPAVMTATSVSSSMAPTPSSPTPIATPSPGHTEAVAQATAQRLRRFSLSNYVAPGSSTPPARPARSGAEPKVESNDKVSTTISSLEAKDETISPENKQLLPVATSSSPRSQPNVVTPPITSSVSPSTKSEPSSTPATPPVEANSESLYNWFVQQWCFAGIPSALPDHGSRPIEHASRGSFGLDIEGGR
ncbi:putative phosphatase regulatory subunit-domain-containing protein [Rhodocollybia butyracea]|uniref:Phosphatase regulatory subunit-domain-containing protein n=1 Tax=Rhodocollybia butyracea TaxID=206335 RepID=A0A9P5Q0R4_9AGAR|nr:putative phosphatase regulatory subunit-domain-containing protein [Rhodocollybia butyracea]